MTGPVYTVRQCDLDGTVITEFSVDGPALQASFDAEGHAATIRRLRRQVPGEPPIVVWAGVALILYTVAVLATAALPGGV